LYSGGQLLGSPRFFDVKLEQQLIGARGRAGLHERGAHRFGEWPVGAPHGPTGEVELIVALRVGKAVNGHTTVAQQIVALGRRPDQPIQPALVDDGTERMQPRSAVLADSRQVTQTHAELIEELAAGGGHVRVLPFKFAPCCHDPASPFAVAT